jgi:GNAT superfamily N-acetyltransferase
MQADTTVKLISAEDTLILRQLVLRPTFTVKDCIYPEDKNLTTFHVGVFTSAETDNGLDDQHTKLVCVATFIQQQHFDFSEKIDGLKSYRLRGMACDAQFQKRGLGRLALEFGIKQITELSGQFLWCNARQSAFEFYEKIGFTIYGPMFDIAGIGPHKVMYKYLGLR